MTFIFTLILYPYLFPDIQVLYYTILRPLSTLPHHVHPTNPHLITAIQSDSGGKVSIVVGYSIGHCEKKKLI
jgi:hypothetical protein